MAQTQQLALHAGLPPDVLRAVFRLTEPSLVDWMSLRAVCKAWRDVAGFSAMQHACVGAERTRELRLWEQHRTQFIGLRSLHLAAPWQALLASGVLEELSWRVCGTHLHGLSLDTLPCTGRLRSLHLHLPGGVTLRHLHDNAFPELLELHVSSDNFCNVAYLTAAAVPRLRDLQLESKNPLKLPDLTPFGSLERLALVAPSATHSVPGLWEAGIKVSNKVQLVAVTTEPALGRGALLASATAVVIALSTGETPDKTWERLPPVFSRERLLPGADCEVFAESSLKEVVLRHADVFGLAWQQPVPITWLDRQEALQQANLSCLWPLAVTLPQGVRHWPVDSAAQSQLHWY